MSTQSLAVEAIRVQRLVDLECAADDRNDVLAGIRRIFRTTAARWPSEPDAARAFQDLWLDQYLRHERDLVFAAVGGSDQTPVVVGYLVGCKLNPALSERFAALGYLQNFASECARFPAHLHVNIDDGFRGRGIGERLIEALCERLRAHDVAGVHVVTGRDQRNVGFYTRIGFSELARTPRGQTEMLFLARKLHDPAGPNNLQRNESSHHS